MTALILPMTAFRNCWVITSFLFVASFHFSEAIGQVIVTEIKVIDQLRKGVTSRIIEISREEIEIPVDKTDSGGILHGKFPCKQLHKFFARPIAGPYMDSDPTTCSQKMVFTVLNTNYPIRPVRIILPAVVGSLTDVTARLIAQKLAERWEQPVIVDNKPGASGTIAVAATTQSTPDGYTLFLGASSVFTIYPLLYLKHPVDPVKDLAPVTMVASTQDVLVAGKSLPTQSVKDLIQLTKGKPGQISFASAGNGTPSHLAGEMFKYMAGVNIVHVPYKGTAPALVDLTDGRVELLFIGVQPSLSRIKSGELKALGVTGSKRSILLPDVPTIAEAGVAGYEASTWSGVFAPAKTPKEIIRKINVDVAGILKSPDVKEKLKSQGAEPIGNTSEQFAAVIDAEISRWAKVVKAADIRAE